MLSASPRFLIRFRPISREGWRCMLGYDATTSNRNYSTTQQKIVRLNNRKTLPSGRASSTNPSAPPPPPPPVPAPPPPPQGSAPPPPPDSSQLKYVLAAAAAAGIAGAVYYFSNKTDSKAPTIPQEKKARVVLHPPSVEDIPSEIEYLLIGGGTASFAAFRAIKSNQPRAKVLVISEENAFPYMRPPLSKELWRNTELPPLDKLTFKQWNGNERSIYYEGSAFYADVKSLPTLDNGGVGVARGYRVTSIDPTERTATVGAPGQPDKVVKYNKCLIATGVRPRNVPVFSQADRKVQSRVVLLRNVSDAAALWSQLARPGTRDLVVVGSGFLGSEIACSLADTMASKGGRVTQIFRESGVLARLLPQYLAQWTSDQLTQLGVTVMPQTEIKRAYMKGDRVALELSNGETKEADVIVVGAGSEPNVEFAARSGVEIHPQLGGILVNAEMQARSDLYAAGDVACFHDARLGRRRVEHHDHAVVSGRLAGNNMAAQRPSDTYTHQSMFWSDLGPDTGLEAIGLVDSSLQTVAVFAEATKAEKAAIAASASAASSTEGAKETQDPSSTSVKETQSEGAEPTSERDSKKDDTSEQDGKYEKGVVFYLRDKKIVGILMWNLFNRMPLARQILAQDEVFDDLNEVAKLFHLHG